MSWLGENWLQRLPLSVLNAGGANAADLSFTIPSDFDYFWDNSLSTFNDLRITAADGITLLDFQALSGANHANKTLSLVVNNYSWANEGWGDQSGAAQSNTIVKAYLYWNNSTSNLASGQASNFHAQNDISSAVTPGFQLARPGAYSTPMIVCEAQGEAQTTPTQTIVKQSSETTIVWWDLRGCMMYRQNQSSGSILLEEIAWTRIEAVRADGTNLSSSMLDAASLSYSNHHVVSHNLRGGTDGDAVLLTLTVGTDDGMGGTRVLEYNCNVKIKNLIADTN